MSELLYLIWFTCSTSFSPSAKRFLDVYTPEELYRFGEREYVELGFGSAQIKRLLDKSLLGAEKILNICRHKDISIIAYNSKDYPPSLLKVDNHPLILYAKGDVSLLKNRLVVGIVGTRTSTSQGEALTEQIAKQLIEEHALIISGGASGIDSVGLCVSVEKRHPCIVVLGCDIDRYYPSKNYALFEHVASCGLVISEYPPGTNARYFPMRNRIIAALSDRLLVTQAPEKSGALITADYASEYSVPIFCPDLEKESFEGCRALILNGARKFTTVEDVIAHSSPTPLKKSTTKRAPKKKTAEKIEFSQKTKNYNNPCLVHIINCIKEGKNTPESMMNNSYGITEVLCALTELEIMGDVKELPGNKFTIN